MTISEQDEREAREWLEAVAGRGGQPDGWRAHTILALLDAAEAGMRARDAALLLANAYEELRATVKGECPSLLNEDSGASVVLLELDMKATDAIRALAMEARDDR